MLRFAMIYHLSKDVPLRRAPTLQTSSDFVDAPPPSPPPPTLQHSLSDSAASATAATSAPAGSDQASAEGKVG